MGIPLVVIGFGGFGREVVDVIEAVNSERNPRTAEFDVIGIIADPPPDHLLLDAYQCFTSAVSIV